jgi:hypothetical protein
MAAPTSLIIAPPAARQPQDQKDGKHGSSDKDGDDSDQQQ